MSCVCAHPTRHGLHRPARSGVLPGSQGRSEHLRGQGFGPGPSCPSASLTLSPHVCLVLLPPGLRPRASSSHRPSPTSTRSTQQPGPASAHATPHAQGRGLAHFVPRRGPLASCFTPSPAPILNINSASFSQGLELMSGFSVPKEPRMYPKLSGCTGAWNPCRCADQPAQRLPHGTPAPAAPPRRTPRSWLGAEAPGPGSWTGRRPSQLPASVTFSLCD